MKHSDIWGKYGTFTLNINEMIMLCYFLSTENFGAKANYGGFERMPVRNYDDMKKNIGLIMKEKTPSRRADLEKKYGVRYTELVRLEYFDAITFTIIDPMHNLFLGTAKAMLKSIWPDFHSKFDNLALEAIQNVVDASITPP